MNGVIKHGVILEKTERAFEKSDVLDSAFFQDAKFMLNKHTYLSIKNLKIKSIKRTLAFNTKRNYTSTETIKKILYVWDKNVVFFPKNSNGKFIALHKLFSSIQIVAFGKNELIVAFWKEY
ncbi:hypothetical protein [Flavobacterium sp. N2038]|uniref:hypothetical protein n=1 Tax=Flavobacterium sp. N2038 TaxID=2986829 RepID=UPI002224406D|nr:hypothetical protein [Flavobacterium sp. N2038]